MRTAESASPGPLSRWLPVLLWAGLIALFSTESFQSSETDALLRPLLRLLLPGASEATLTQLHAAVRKLAHVTEYAVLGFLTLRALLQPGRPAPRSALSALLLCALAAALDELHQGSLPTRTGSLWDVALDSAGAALGVAVRAWTAQR